MIITTVLGLGVGVQEALFLIVNILLTFPLLS